MKNLFLSSIILFAACHSNSDLSIGDYSESFEDIPATRQPAPSTSHESINPEKKLIKRGGIDFLSKDVEKDYLSIKHQLPHLKAYIESENQYRSARDIRYELIIRVPAGHYDSLYKSITDLAYKLENKFSNVEDVTEQFYDLQSRIKNKKALEQRYLDLLKKTTTIKDILEVEKSLNEVRTTIETLEGQFKYLSKQIGFSTLNVSFREELPYVYNATGRKGFWARMHQSLSSGWQGFLSFLIAVVALWPIVILLTAAIFLFKKWRSRKSSSNSETDI